MGSVRTAKLQRWFLSGSEMQMGPHGKHVEVPLGLMGRVHELTLHTPGVDGDSVLRFPNISVETITPCA